MDRHVQHHAELDAQLCDAVTIIDRGAVRYTGAMDALLHGHDEHLPARVLVQAGFNPSTGAPMLEVSDHGPGIPDSLVLQVFEPFFTTSEVGSGLGLYIARQICEANQASLTYQRRAEGGSCFRITLPPAVALQTH